MRWLKYSVILLFCLNAFAQNNFQTGLQAYQNGDYSKAFRILLPLAEKADAEAMMYVGRMYENGQGVQRDRMEAFAWYLLSLEEGNEDVEEQYLLPLEESLGPDRLDSAMERADILRKKVAGNYNFPDSEMNSYPEYPPYNDRPPVPGNNYSDNSKWGNQPQNGNWESSQQLQNVSLRCPQNWRQTQNNEGQVKLTSSNGEELIIWPFYLERPLRKTDASFLLNKFARNLGSQFQWNDPQAVGNQLLRCIGSGGGESAIAGLGWSAGSGRSAGFVYFISGPQQQLRTNENVYLEILKSFRVQGSGRQGASNQSGTNLQYQKWQDPVEQAFTIEVPQGWQVSGGLVRRSAVDVTKSVQVVSPDRQIQLFIGDGNIPVYTEPNQILQMSGFTEGSWYSPGYGAQMMVMRYRPGVTFAAEYVQNRFARQYAQFQITGSRDLPDASQAINQIYQQNGVYGVQQQLSTGEVQFRCSDGGRQYNGYTFAGTALTSAPQYSTSIWQVDYLYGYLADSDRRVEAEKALAHVVGSLQMNPSWLQMQQGITGNVSQIVTKTNQYVSNIINQSYEAQQRSQDEMARRYSNYIRGMEDVRDPNTGETYKVESSSEYYWIDAAGNIVGTDLDTNPDPLNLQKMVRLP